MNTDTTKSGNHRLTVRDRWVLRLYQKHPPELLVDQEISAHTGIEVEDVPYVKSRLMEAGLLTTSGKLHKLTKKGEGFKTTAEPEPVFQRPQHAYIHGENLFKESGAPHHVYRSGTQYVAARDEDEAVELLGDDVTLLIAMNDQGIYDLRITSFPNRRVARNAATRYFESTGKQSDLILTKDGDYRLIDTIPVLTEELMANENYVVISRIDERGKALNICDETSARELLHLPPLSKEEEE